LGENLTTVAVKQGLSRYSARQIPPIRARDMIEQGAYKALQNLQAVQPYVPSSPVTITVEVDKVEKMADFKGHDNVELDMELQKVMSRGQDWMQAWDQIWHW
jgi:D-amino peptidase